MASSASVATDTTVPAPELSVLNAEQLSLSVDVSSKEVTTVTNSVVSSLNRENPAAMGNPGQVQSPSKVNRLDAISYLEHVKRTYAERPAVYNTFLEIMKDFKAQTYRILF